MLFDKRNTVGYERAELSRRIEYVKNMTNGSEIDKRMYQLDRSVEGYNESADLKGTMEIAAKITTESDEDRDEEISRIMNATEDMTIDNVMGITESVDYEYIAREISGMARSRESADDADSVLRV